MFLFDLLQVNTCSNEYVIKYDDQKLDQVLSDMFEISCIEIIKFFAGEKEIQFDNQISIINNTKSAVLEIIKKEIFKNFLTIKEQIKYSDLIENFVSNTKSDEKVL